MNQYDDTKNPFSNNAIKSFKNEIIDSRYFLEAITSRIAKNGNIPMLNFMTESNDFCYLFNINMGKYILENMFHKIVPSDSIYKKKFNEGYANFNKRFASEPPHSHKTWNSLSHIYNTIIKKELLDEKIKFTDEEIQRAFYISGMATKHYEFEEEHSIIVASFFLLESAGKTMFPFARSPIVNEYRGAMPYRSKRTMPVPKVEFIVLKEMGVVDKLVENFTLVEVASDLAYMINEKYNLEGQADKCSAANIRNILIADAYSPDPKNAKSAYKKNNIKKALAQLVAMGKNLEDCKYLPQLNLTNPDLFI